MAQIDTLNKKLAEWRFGEDNLDYNPLGAIGQKLHAWVKWEGLGQPPVSVIDGRIAVSIDFPNDLNACFKWLVPKVLEEYNIEFYSFKQDSGLYYSEVNVWRKGNTKHSFEVLQDEHIAKHFEQGSDLDKITALALCLAISELIDEKDSTSS